MSKLKDDNKRPEIVKKVWIDQCNAYVEFGIPPKSEETELERMRCARLLLDMYLKHGHKLWPKEESQNALTT
jgi:hypothetical protein